MATVSEVVREFYDKTLLKKGKPLSNEWTVFAAIVMIDDKTEGREVVAFALGNKCIGQTKMDTSGCLINDSHAEVLVRRSFKA